MATGNAGGIRAAKAFVEMYVNNVGLQKGLKKAESRLRSFQGGIAKITAGMFDWRTMLAGGGSAGFIAKEFATFEQSMARVSTMLDEPEKHMDAFTKGVKDMAIETGININEIANALKEVVSAQIEPGSALDVLMAGGKMAIAGEATIFQSVKLITGLINSYKLTVQDATKISDVMFQTIKYGTTDITGLSNALGTVAPFAKIAGMTMGNMMSMFSTLTRSMLSTEEAGVRIARMLQEYPKDLKHLQDVIKTFKGMDLAGVLERVTEIRASQGFAILGVNFEELVRDMWQMENAAGATETAYKKMSGTLLMWFNRVREAIRQVAIAVGEALGPGLKKYGDAAINALRGLVGIINRNHDALIQFVKVTAGIMAVGMALLFVSKMAGLLIFVINVLEIMLNKWLLIPAVVAAAVLYMSGGFAEIKRVATDAMDGVKKAMEGGDVLLAIKIFWTSVKLLWAEAVNGIKTTWDGFVASLARAGGWVSFLTSQYGIVGELKKMWWEAVRNIKDAVASIAAAAAKITLRTTPLGWLAAAMPGDQGKMIDDALTRTMAYNLDEMNKKQSDFDARRLSALKNYAYVNDVVNENMANGIIEREKEINALREQQRALIAEANRPKSAAGAGGAGFPAFGGVPGMGGAGAMSSLIANQIAEARGAFLTGRSFGWGAGGANAKSKELETAEQSRDFLRRIETNTRTGGVIVGA